jgi:hypothetical protein
MPAAGTGEWSDERTLMMDVDTVGGLALLRLRFELDGDSLTLTVEDMDSWHPDPPLVLSGPAAD